MYIIICFFQVASALSSGSKPISAQGIPSWSECWSNHTQGGAGAFPLISVHADTALSPSTRSYILGTSPRIIPSTDVSAAAAARGLASCESPEGIYVLLRVPSRHQISIASPCNILTSPQTNIVYWAPDPGSKETILTHLTLGQCPHGRTTPHRQQQSEKLKNLPPRGYTHFFWQTRTLVVVGTRGSGATILSLDLATCGFHHRKGGLSCRLHHGVAYSSNGMPGPPLEASSTMFWTCLTLICMGSVPLPSDIPTRLRRVHSCVDLDQSIRGYTPFTGESVTPSLHSPPEVFIPEGSRDPQRAVDCLPSPGSAAILLTGMASVYESDTHIPLIPHSYNVGNRFKQFLGWTMAKQPSPPLSSYISYYHVPSLYYAHYHVSLVP